MLVDDAGCEGLDAALEGAEVDAGDGGSGGKTDGAWGAVFDEGGNEENDVDREHGFEHASESEVVEGLEAEIGRREMVVSKSVGSRIVFRRIVFREIRDGRVSHV